MDEKCHFTVAEIVLDDNKTWYQVGEDVSGITKFTLKGSAIVAKIKICLFCVSEVKWVEIPISPHHIGPFTYQDKIILFKQTFPLPEEYERLSDGEYEVPFTFKLNEAGIPSSFIGPRGSIKYFIEVLHEEVGENEGHRVGLCEIKVDAPSGQNLNISIGCSKEKDFGLLSTASGKLILYASFIRKGWTPGELLELDVTVDNQSSVDVSPRATLYQLQVYLCDDRHSAFETQLTGTIVGKKVEKHKNFTETLLIPTPKDAPLTIKSPLIIVKYFVHVTLDIPNAFDIHVNVPVVMTNKSVLSAH